MKPIEINELNCARLTDAPRLELRILRYRPLRADDSWQVHAVCWPEPRLASPGLFASLTRQFLALNKLQRSRRKTLKATLDSFNLGIASGMTPSLISPLLANVFPLFSLFSIPSKFFKLSVVSFLFFFYFITFTIDTKRQYLNFV